MALTKKNRKHVYVNSKTEVNKMTKCKIRFTATNIETEVSPLLAILYQLKNVARVEEVTDGAVEDPEVEVEGMEESTTILTRNILVEVARLQNPVPSVDKPFDSLLKKL